MYFHLSTRKKVREIAVEVKKSIHTSCKDIRYIHIIGIYIHRVKVLTNTCFSMASKSAKSPVRTLKWIFPEDSCTDTLETEETETLTVKIPLSRKLYIATET